MDSFLDNTTDSDLDLDYLDDFKPPIQPIQIVALVFYGLVALVGVGGNAMVVGVAGFCMPRSVTSIWFLNLALADLLCCLSLPLLMVPLTHDDHWHFGSVGCKLVKGCFYLVMFCSILQLVVISIDRLMLVIKPVWCQNNRRPRQALFVCVAVWCLALIGSTPQFYFAFEHDYGSKKECMMGYTPENVWVIFSFRFLMGFILPFLVIVYCHFMVYKRTQTGLSRGRTRSKRTLRIILAVMVSFFFCWLPFHVMDIIDIKTRRSSPYKPVVYHLYVLALCLAYFNSCLNPLLYVCLGRNFKDSVNRSLRGVFNFITEDHNSKGTFTTNESKSTSTEKEVTV